jgi:hypothetical protein
MLDNNTKSYKFCYDYTLKSNNYQPYPANVAFAKNSLFSGFLAPTFYRHREQNDTLPVRIAIQIPLLRKGRNLDFE